MGFITSRVSSPDQAIRGHRDVEGSPLHTADNQENLGITYYTVEYQGFVRTGFRGIHLGPLGFNFSQHGPTTRPSRSITSHVSPPDGSQEMREVWETPYTQQVVRTPEPETLNPKT